MAKFDDFLMESYELREKLVADKFRPRYHFLPPEGRWNDLNGAIYWNGRYHLGYLQKITNGPDELDFSSWQHISSRDLLHWRYHKASLREPLPGKKGDYFNSGDAMAGMDVPTIIANMPRKGICIYQSHDENLDEWTPLPENPVIPIEAGWSRYTDMLNADALFPECVIFDPSGWKEGDTYYALIGNKNYRPGYEGDSTSLFKSKDLRQWDYVGPFYKSDRRWTTEEEDCACSDFFPFGDKHMLVMHTHRPISKCQYYIGRYENETFFPEINGQLSHLGSMLAGPETLIDDQGRRLFWGWIRDARDANEVGWNSIMTLPWHFMPGPDHSLKIKPVSELETLRYNQKQAADMTLSDGDEVLLDTFTSDCMELKLTLNTADAKEYGVKVFCSPDKEEETVISYNVDQQTFIIDFEKASNDMEYPCGPQTLQSGNLKQRVPYMLSPNQPLELTIFVDRSVLEIFVNGDICIVQRVYPMRADSKQVRLFSNGGTMTATDLVKWEMDATNPW
ncbi:MAG: glycoside hydrolase family 32 protein [Chloroflexota bacterium]